MKNVPFLVPAMAALLFTACASGLTAPEGKLGSDMEADRSACEAEARSASLGEFKLWPPPSAGLRLVDPGAIGMGLIGGTVKYFVTYEKSVGDMIDRCMRAKGYLRPGAGGTVAPQESPLYPWYSADMSEPDPNPIVLSHNEMH